MDMLTLRNRTKEKNERIIDCGWNLVEEYECGLKENKEFLKFFKGWDRECIEPLNPRDAFFGGQTNVTKLTYDFKEGEKGKYVDFVSLYPTVQFYKDYPVGHPEKIFLPDEYDLNWFGFVKHDETQRGLTGSISKECGVGNPAFLSYFSFAPDGE